jgi:hypothetical protein
LQSKTIRLGAAGAIAALAVSAIGLPAQAAQPLAPGITVEAATVLPPAQAPTSVQLGGMAQPGMELFVSYRGSTSQDGKTAFQWLRNGAAITGAAGLAYRPAGADIGKRISYRATFTQPGRKPVTLTSPTSTPVPTWTLGPTVTGTGTPGSILRGALKSPWMMAVPVAMKYQWLRNGVPVKGATALTYKVGAADLNTRIVLRAQGVSAGKVLATSYSVPVTPSALKRMVIAPQVAFGVPGNPKMGPALGGMPQAGDTLVFSPAGWKQAGAKSAIQWLRNGAVIPGATARTYKLTTADVGSKVTAIVIGSAKGYADTIVEGAWLDLLVQPAPAAGSMPVLTGSATAGSVLKVTWKDPKAAFTWFRNFKPIPGVTGSTYKTTAADKGAVIAAIARASDYTEYKYTAAVLIR